MASLQDTPNANGDKRVSEPRKRHSWRFWTSWIYLSLGGLGLIGFLEFFLSWEISLRGLFLFAIPYYLLTLTFTIWVHPIVGVLCTLAKRRDGIQPHRVAIALSSFLLASIFTYLVFGRGWIITV